MSATAEITWTTEQQHAMKVYDHTVLAVEGEALAGVAVSFSKQNASRMAILGLERAGVVAVYQEGMFAFYEPKFSGHEQFAALDITEDQLKEPRPLWMDGSINFFVELCNPNAGDLNPRRSFDGKTFDRLAERLVCHGFRNINYYIGGF